MSKPTPALALEASRKAMSGDARAIAILKRWMDEHPDIIIQALQDHVSELLG